MNELDYIRAGIELADEWRFNKFDKSLIYVPNGISHITVRMPDLTKVYKAALAAQLAEQVIEAGYYYTATQDFTEIWTTDDDGRDETYAWQEEEGPTMNTIMAVVDSERLKRGTL